MGLLLGHQIRPSAFIRRDEVARAVLVLLLRSFEHAHQLAHLAAKGGLLRRFDSESGF
jgi:hypothetical protein